MTTPKRSEIKASDCWDLSSLFSTQSEWESSLQLLQSKIEGISDWSGRLGQGAGTLRSCLEYLNAIGVLDEKLGYYAFLSMSEDAGDSLRQSMQARYTQIAVHMQTTASYIQPELIGLPQETLQSYLADENLRDFRISLEKMIRYKPHTLSASEERILAMQEEANQTAAAAFRALTDVDLNFGTVETPEGNIPLTQSSFGALQMHADRSVRERAYRQFYQHIEAHQNTLASLYAGSINLDTFQAKVRNFPSSLEAALFPDRVEQSVYDSLISSIRGFFPQIHRYYALRARILKLDQIAIWDCKVSLVPDVKTNYSYDQAVDLVISALAPLGQEYCDQLGHGLRNGWVDRYENKGKRSGAFSAGSYSAWPYILLNYKDTVLRDVFTLAHEAGHSMHSWYSARNNPFQHYKYSIFEAEVASTFNEQLLFNHMMASQPNDSLKAYLINKQLDDILATIIRQTMFAEFEKTMHQKAETGQGLTLESFRSSYRQLLEDYFGPQVQLTDTADLEGLRIPHFYRAFYVYKYATGLSAACALSQQVLHDCPQALQRYTSFLKSGGSSYPLENLKKAGVDLTTELPVKAALQQFATLLDQLETLLETRP